MQERRRLWFRWATKKGLTIEMPKTMRELFPEDQVDFTLQLQDEKGQRHPVIYDKHSNCVYIAGLAQWVRDFEPDPADDILLELIDPTRRLFAIRLKRQRPSAPPKDALYLGYHKDRLGRKETHRQFSLPLEELLTHMFICGITGTGKTVLGKAVIEEGVLQGIPAILVDLKGDISSLALALESLDEAQFAPWVEASTPEEKRAQLERTVAIYREQLSDSNVDEDRLRAFKQRASFAVFTPLSEHGIPLAITSPLPTPPDIKHLLQGDKEEAVKIAGSLTSAFTRMLFPEKKTGRLNKYKTYLEHLVLWCWEHGEILEDVEGLHRLAELVLESPFTHIGPMTIHDFFQGPSAINELAARITMGITGEQRLWFRGVPLRVEVLLSRPTALKVPVSIVNLSLLSLDDQMYVVSNLAHAIFNWARHQGDSEGKPRLMFFIDEIGGGGGRLAFYPSRPHDPPSKAGLDRLLRQGRAFGVCCILATQNPGQVDYMGLSNCRTWAVGQLQTERDRKKIAEGFSKAELLVDRVEEHIATLRNREFLLKRREGEAQYLTTRWLMSYHKTLAERQLIGLTSDEVRKWFDQYIVRE